MANPLSRAYIERLQRQSKKLKAGYDALVEARATKLPELVRELYNNHPHLIFPLEELFNKIENTAILGKLDMLLQEWGLMRESTERSAPGNTIDYAAYREERGQYSHQEITERHPEISRGRMHAWNMAYGKRHRRRKY